MDLSKLTSDDAYALVDEIPSDAGSYTSGAPSEDDIEVLDDDDFVEVQDNTTENINLEYDSEDELPLSNFVQKPIEWTKNLKFANKPSAFTQDFGPNVPENVETPTDIFLCLFTTELIGKIVFETNLYATQQFGDRFLPTNSDEIKCFLGINLMMGLTKKPSYRDYWSSKMQMRDNFISSSMSRDRFSWLLTNMHLNDNSVQPNVGQTGFDKLYKIRPMLDTLSDTFGKYYKPSENQSIDESMVKFKGRIGFRQYMPLKPIKRGYKIWIRADQSAFVAQFQIYTGKSEGGEEGLGPRVVKDLTRTLVGKYHRVFFDNFFTSVALLNDLLKDNIYGCGTIRRRRKNEPKDIVNNNAKVSRGTCDWTLSKEGLLYLKWMDNKPVLFLSNFHSPADVQTVSRKQKDGSSQNIDCLKLVKDYNSHMGYVDQSDMFVSLYKLNRKSRKWWHRLFWHFLDLTIVNAFIIFRDRTPDTRSMTLKDYRLAVAIGLIGADPSMPKKGKRSTEKITNKFKILVPAEIRFDKCAHLPVHDTKVRCAHCSTRLQPHRTRWHCSKCNVGLCLTEASNCFFKFHRAE